MTLLILWMAGGVQRPRITRPAPVHLSDVATATIARDRTLSVVTWNIAWGYGRGSEGTGQAKSAEHFERTLEAMGQVLKQAEADVVLLQEVDFDSARSHHVDQAEVLARAAGLPYVAKAVSWEAGYVPFPYWPPADQFGAMQSGGAILSRYPIESHRVETVDKPAANPWWYNLFYLFRYHQQVEIQAPFGSVLAVNLHTDAFDQENRVAHAKRLADQLSGALTPESVVGGDFNTVPPEASERSGYEDEPETDHSDDPTLGFIRGLSGLVDTVPADLYIANESAWFTFPADAPNRKLDHLFHGAGLEVIDVEVLRGEATELSDHLPIYTRLRPVGG